MKAWPEESGAGEDGIRKKKAALSGGVALALLVVRLGLPQDVATSFVSQALS